LRASHAFPEAQVHYDFHPGNALFRGARLVAILDLDSVARQPRMQAVAFACSRLASAPAVFGFLAAYHQVDPLSLAEVRAYPFFVMREAVARINWVLRTNVLENHDLWREALPKHQETLQRMKELVPAFAGEDAVLAAKLAGPPAGLGEMS
jgi:Ser/Thr protein kinase RdoA (MazF antagonist)